MKKIRKTLYIGQDDDDRLTTLAEALTQEGIIERDNRGLPSQSATVRWLIEKEIKRRELTP